MEAVQRERAGVSSDEAHEAQLLAVLDALPIAVMLRAADGSLLHANPATVRFLARSGSTSPTWRPAPAP